MEVAIVQRRTLRLLFVTQIISGIGIAIGGSVGALLAAEIASIGVSGLALERQCRGRRAVCAACHGHRARARPPAEPGGGLFRRGGGLDHRSRGRRATLDSAVDRRVLSARRCDGRRPSGALCRRGPGTRGVARPPPLADRVGDDGGCGRGAQPGGPGGRGTEPLRHPHFGRPVLLFGVAVRPGDAAPHAAAQARPGADRARRPGEPARDRQPAPPTAGCAPRYVPSYRRRRPAWV